MAYVVTAYVAMALCSYGCSELSRGTEAARIPEARAMANMLP